MNSALYAGWVTHHRLAPTPHRLRYAMFQMLLDLDEGHELARRVRLFSMNRFNVFSHVDADHGEGRPAALRGWVEETLGEEGVAIHGGKILLLAMPRLFGHVFNPLSIYYCHLPDGALAATIYEVNNTFGERHAYVIPVGDQSGDVIRQSCAKTFRVSPFMDMAMTYDFELSAPGETVRTSVNARDTKGELILSAIFTGARRELADAGVLTILVGFPLMTLKVVAAIRLEALKMWLKGLRLKPQF